MYENYLFPLNEIGFKTAKALHDKYIRPYQTSADKTITPGMVRAGKIIGRLHDRVKFNPDKYQLSKGERTKFNAMAGNSNRIITQNIVDSVKNSTSDPVERYKLVKKIHSDTIKPLIRNKHIGLDASNYTNNTLATADAIASLSNHNTVKENNKSSDGIFWMGRNAQQIRLNQMFQHAKDVQRQQNEKKPGSGKILNPYYYMQTSRKWENWDPSHKYFGERSSL